MTSKLFENLIWLNSNEATQYLRVTNGALRLMIYRGILKPYKLGRRNRFKKDELNIDEEQYMANLGIASMNAFNLAFNIEYPTKGNIRLLISKNSLEASSLASKVDFENIKEKHKDHHIEKKSVTPEVEEKTPVVEEKQVIVIEGNKKTNNN